MMKLKNIITSLVLVAISSGLYAQTMVTTDPDTVTVGSTMPYAVTPDSVIANMAGMDPSDFYWTVTDDVDTELSDGSNFNIVQGNSGDTLTNDSITIEWGASPGDYKVKVAEISNPQFGQGCMGDTSERNIMIVDVPAVAFNGTEAGGCGIDTVSVPLDVSGYGPFLVSYEIAYDSDGSGADTTYAGSTQIGSHSDGGLNMSLAMELNVTEDLDQGFGTYTVTFTDIKDAASGKSLADITGDFDPADNFVIGSYPEPNTSPIRHLENVY